MAKPLPEISKTDFRNHYNIVEVLNDIDLIMKTLQTFNPNNQAVAFGVRKQHTITTDERLSKIEETLVLIIDEIKSIKLKLNEIETNQTNDHNLLMKVIKLNNLKTE